MKRFDQQVREAIEERDEGALRFNVGRLDGWRSFERAAAEPQPLRIDAWPWAAAQASRLEPAAVPMAGTAPVASNGSAAGFRNKALNGFLEASDGEGDMLSYSIVSQPAQGSVVLNGGE
jgi:hypothetical protein